MPAWAARSAKARRRRRRGEVEDAVGAGKSGSGIGGDRDAVRAEPGELAGILADLGGIGPLDGAGERDARRLGDDADQRPPHPAGGADDGKAHVGGVHGLAL